MPEGNVVIILDPGDSLTGAGPVRWAVSRLQEALAVRGISASVVDQQAPADVYSVIASGSSSPAARRFLDAAGLPALESAESFVLAPAFSGGAPATLACGSDTLGLVYALLELADRVEYGADPTAALSVDKVVVEQPVNRIRCISRYFVSDIEDKTWFYDRDFWQRYLSMLVTQRFNWFHLGFGIGHNFLRDILDAYFVFPYPFIVSVPGYDVRVTGLPDEERDRNLNTLKFISRQAAVRGLHFQLGLWMHGYSWDDTPNPNYRIAGVTPENHAAYCRDALCMVLQECPEISGITFRVHGESGVPEGSHGFWRTVFDGIVQCGRKIVIDLHPKGIDAGMFRVALDTGMPVCISPKFTAEHQGLPAQQSSIRLQELNFRLGMEDHLPTDLMALSAGSLRYTRYGYADFLKEDRRYGVLWRMWPGTQRFLLWGDPVMAAGYGRTGAFCGCLGMDYSEPLSYKGRMGSGLPGNRLGYADASLAPAGGDYEKFLYTYRLLGRCMYNPDADPESWRRFLRHEFGLAAEAVEAALACASRVLPVVTTAYHPSASNHRYWPEIYTNMPIVSADRTNHYLDTPIPRRFGTVTGLDPEMFSAVDEFANEVASGKISGRHSPLQVAHWLDGLAASAERSLSDAMTKAPDPTTQAFRRLAIDVTIQAALGRFFAHKLRAGVAWALYQQTGSVPRLEQATAAYRSARAAFADAARAAGGVYVQDITFGCEPWLRGHWLDRLPAIDADLADMETELKKACSPNSGDRSPTLEPLDALDPPTPAVDCRHEPPADFRAGKDLRVVMTAVTGSTAGLKVRLHYRHVNQAERYMISEMTEQDGQWVATIPGNYTASPYALQYFFELRVSQMQAWLWPGLGADLSNQPYFVVRAA